MSSIQERIRNLQSCSSDDTPRTPSVSARAKQVDANGEKDAATRAPSLTELAQKFGSGGEDGATPRSLQARVAAFDTGSVAGSLDEKVKLLESGAPRGRVRGGGVFEECGRGGNAVGGRYVERVGREEEGGEGVRKARAMFEDAGKAKTCAAEGSARARGVGGKKAVFEGAAGSTPRASAAKAGLEVGEVESVGSKCGELGGGGKEGTCAMSVHDELGEVKRANEELVATLLELTGAFKRLDATKESLQKRVAQLEASMKK